MPGPSLGEDLTAYGSHEIDELEGTLSMDIYFCGYCNTAVAATDKTCPHCTATLSQIRCPACKFVGSSEDYIGDRCPRCGCRRLILE